MVYTGGVSVWCTLTHALTHARTLTHVSVVYGGGVSHHVWWWCVSVVH